MTTLQVCARVGAVVAGLAALNAGAAHAQKKGGDIIIAQQAQPPTMDGMTTSAQATRNISLHIWETLVARDENANVIGDLATAWKISDDGLTYTFTLREIGRAHV